jgi:transposase-like protein
MEQLHKAIREPDPLVVCNDACKGLTTAIQAVFSNAEKRECSWHLMQNYVKHFDGLEHIYPATKPYRTEVFECDYSSAIAIPGEPWKDK